MATLTLVCAAFALLSIVNKSTTAPVGYTGRHRRSNDPALKILPSGDQMVRAGKNLVLTCRAHVPNPELISHLRWFAPSGELIPQDDRVYSEDQPGDAATALFIKKLQERDSGVYRCTAKYAAANHHLEASVKISTFIGITWEDAPTEQFARINNDYKIRCVVRANPPANIDWLKESLIISTGDQFVIESDGLLIKEIKRENAGTYTCRARVAETEELEERDIVLDVQEPPSLALEPSERINASSPLGSQTMFLTFICLSLSSQLLHILDLTASR